MIRRMSAGRSGSSPGLTAPALTALTPGDAPSLTSGPAVVSDHTVMQLRKRYGPKIEPWIQALPATLTALQERWSLAYLHAHPGASSSYVAATTQGGSAVVLKVSPEPKLLEREAAALRHWGPTGATPVVRAAERGAILLERVLPGTPLRQVTQEAAGTVSYGGANYGLGSSGGRSDTEYDKAVLHCLSQLSSAGQPRTSSWPELGPILERRLAKYQVMLQSRPELDVYGAVDLIPPALARIRRLTASRTRLILLHADLHPGNVLTDDARGVPTVRAVDPTPCVGDPAYDAAAWAARAGASGVEQRLVRASSHLGHPAERIWNWAAVAAVDHACTLTLHRAGSPQEVEALLGWARRELRH